MSLQKWGHDTREVTVKGAQTLDSVVLDARYCLAQLWVFGYFPPYATALGKSKSMYSCFKLKVVVGCKTSWGACFLWRLRMKFALMNTEFSNSAPGSGLCDGMHASLDTGAPKNSWSCILSS